MQTFCSFPIFHKHSASPLCCIEFTARSALHGKFQRILPEAKVEPLMFIAAPDVCGMRVLYKKATCVPMNRRKNSQKKDSWLYTAVNKENNRIEMGIVHQI